MSIDWPGFRANQHEIRNLRRQDRGFSLVEAVVFIVVIGVGLAGAIMAISTATQDSVDPLIRKQALAIAEALLDEIESMPFTYCDPTDANATTAASAAGCATLPEVMGPEPGETRYSVTTPFNNVNDYNGFTMNPIRDISNNAITGLGNYTAAVAVAPAGFGVVPAASGLLVAVTVTGPSNTTVRVEGYRAQYAPNAVP
jgi:MSHA pilin protein MshD